MIAKKKLVSTTYIKDNKSCNYTVHYFFLKKRGLQI